MNAGEAATIATSVAGLGLLGSKGWRFYRDPDRDWREAKLNTLKYMTFGVGLAALLRLPDNDTWQVPAILVAIVMCDVWAYADRQLSKPSITIDGSKIVINARIDNAELQRNIDEWRKGMR